MNTALDNALDETKRDALVSYYLQYIIPQRGLGTIAASIKTPEDLYEYLLLDPQVSGKVKTSRIAEAIASTQLYIHRCREQLEPGVNAAAMQEASRPGRYLDHWDAYNKRYATWAGLQRLLRYPASYLDPELRYRKTTLFKNLEQTINQGRVTEERVERALRDYMGELRSVLDIRSVSAYQVEPDVHATPVYFVGRSIDLDGSYYWRYVDSSQKGNGGRVRNPVAWSEWRKIEAPMEPEGDPAIVYFNRRVHVLWLSKRNSGVEPVHSSAPSGRAELTRLAEPDRQPAPTFTWELQFATLLANGQWQLRSFPLDELISPTLLTSPKRLFAAELRGVEHSSDRLSSDPHLGVFFVQQEASTEVRYLCRFSKLLQHVDSPGTAWNFDFNYLIESTQQHINYPIFQPLKYHPPSGTAPVYTVSVAPFAGVPSKNPALSGFSLTNGCLLYTSPSPRDS